VRAVERDELAALVAAPWSNLDATLIGMRAIDDWGRRCGDPRGAFAAAYVVVTAAVADALRGRRFEDPEWVARVVVDFAGRYRDGVEGALGGDPRARYWVPALRRTNGGAVAAIVALLHAMIAHIHFDLAHSLGACAPIDGRRAADYEHLGVVICGTTREIQRVLLEHYAPELRSLHGALRGTDTRLTNAILRVWRARARRVAGRMQTSSARATAWSRRLGRESAVLSAGLDALAWSVQFTAGRWSGESSQELRGRMPSARAVGQNGVPCSTIA
jgi:hypothetical protein